MDEPRLAIVRQNGRTGAEVPQSQGRWTESDAAAVATRLRKTVVNAAVVFLRHG
jgi:hypothetical protein